MIRWRELSTGAKALRITHGAIAVVGLTSLAYVWLSAVTGRRDRALAAALGALSVQGVGILIGRGNCPLGPLQRRLGDPTPLFELVLPRRAARLTFPVLGALTLGGLVALAVRPRRAP